VNGDFASGHSVSSPICDSRCLCICSTTSNGQTLAVNVGVSLRERQCRETAFNLSEWPLLQISRDLFVGDVEHKVAQGGEHE